MPSKKPMKLIRVSEEEQDVLIPALIEAIKAETGVAPSMTDVFRMGLHELKKKYLKEDEAKGKKRGKK
jgi:hypothetical protein